MPSGPTRFDHDLTIYESGDAKTDRFERLVAADTNGIFMALIQGFFLELKGTASGHIYAALMNPGTPMMWGTFSGVRPAVYIISAGFEEQREGELPGGPPVVDLKGVEALLLAGATAVVTHNAGAYSATMQRKIGSEQRRQGATMLKVVQTGVRRGRAVDIFDALSSALEESEAIEETLSL